MAASAASPESSPSSVPAICPLSVALPPAGQEKLSSIGQVTAHDAPEHVFWQLRLPSGTLSDFFAAEPVTTPPSAVVTICWAIASRPTAESDVEGAAGGAPAAARCQAAAEDQDEAGSRGRSHGSPPHRRRHLHTPRQHPVDLRRAARRSEEPHRVAEVTPSESKKVYFLAGRRLGLVGATFLAAFSRRGRAAAAGRVGRLPAGRPFPAPPSAFGSAAVSPVAGASAFRRGARFFGTGARAAAERGLARLLGDLGRQRVAARGRPPARRSRSPPPRRRRSAAPCARARAGRPSRTSGRAWAPAARGSSSCTPGSASSRRTGRSGPCARGSGPGCTPGR